MLWYEIWKWQIQFQFFHVYHRFWSMCIKWFRMDSYVPYIIMTFNIKAIYLFFSERSCQFLPKHQDIFRNLKLWSFSDKLHTAFFNLVYTESRAHHMALIWWYSIFHVALQFLIWKQFIFIFQIDPATFYHKIEMSSETWSYGPCQTNFIQLSSISCTMNPEHHYKAFISWNIIFPCVIVIITHCE